VETAPPVPSEDRHQPALTRLDPAGTARAVVLMLHGGKERSRQAVDGRSASWRRSAAMQRAIAPGAHEAGVATCLLRYRRRGWNGGASPVADARWALEQVREAYGDVPVVLLGHSMGARTAVRVADGPGVVGVVALAPWFPPGEEVAALADRHLVAAHGSRDRITSARATAAYVERARGVAASADLVDMGRLGHYMLRGVADWNEVALTRSLDLLDR
jgi:alpha-beta hydrolase superfamily lysophospholipase